MNNKVAIFSDFHLGLKQDSQTWHNIAIEWIDWFINELNSRNIKDIVFLGDFFHNRSTISANTLHVASLILDKLNDFNLFIILGNHDLYYSNQPTVSPVNLFNGRKNITVYTKPELVNFGKHTALFCGWGYSPLDYKADILFTHLEITTFHVNKEVVAASSGTYKPSNILHNFNLVYSGHFHLRQERKWNDKRIVYVGNTFPMNFSDDGDVQKGFDILDLDTLESEFVENKTSPRFYRFVLSELVSGKYSFYELKNMINGNIIKLIIDININHYYVNKLSFLFNENKPLEFNIEWQDTNVIKDSISENNLESFDTEKAIRKYVELIDIDNKEDVKDYLIYLYNKVKF